MRNFPLILGFFCFYLVAAGQDKAPLPDFSLTEVNSGLINRTALKSNMPVVVFYFDPDCDHCQKQAQWIKEDIQQFKNIQMLWISWAEEADIKEFSQNYFGKAGSSYSIYFTKDQDYKIDNWFGYSEVPSVYVYDKNWQRVQTFKKETPVAEIVKGFK